MMDPNTRRIVDYFEQINAIPRCSKNEAQLGQWLRDWAAARNLAVRSDDAGNLVMIVPASKGYEDRLPVILQGHMDMVCEKTPNSPHDFSTDPIAVLRNGDWLEADRTTLGADNGVALAYALALADDADIVHPPLELLFTVDEETGLNGVKQLEPDMITGNLFINLDSEDEGVFTIGCAGGVDTHLNMALQQEALPFNSKLQCLTVGGLIGGHSGIDIHKHRGNANKILARALAHVRQNIRLRLVSFKGGTRHNAIPRDSQAVIAFDAGELQALQEAVAQMEAIVRTEFMDNESALFLKLTDVQDVETPTCLIEDDTDRVLWLLMAMPHGVAHMSAQLEGLVETSSNLAVVSLNEQELKIETSQRSAVMSRLAEITGTIHAVADLAGAQFKDFGHYPAWQPDFESTVLQRAKQVYQRLNGSAPKIEVIHAGLECAIIGDIKPEMDMISFGPTIENPHSPDERLYIPSLGRVWDFLTALLAELP